MAKHFKTIKLQTLSYLNMLSAILGDFFSIRFKPHQVVPCLGTIDLNHNRVENQGWYLLVVNFFISTTTNLKIEVGGNLLWLTECSEAAWTMMRMQICRKNCDTRTYRIRTPFYYILFLMNKAQFFYMFWMLSWNMNFLKKILVVEFLTHV